MQDKIDKIRAALDELKNEVAAGDDKRVLREFSAFDLPEIIKEIATRFSSAMATSAPTAASN